MTGLAIRSTGLTKRFGTQLAVDQVSLAVPRGSVYGFLGPNGSGKTTTIRLLLGLAFATSGQAELLGVPMPAGQRPRCRASDPWSRGPRSTRSCPARTTWPASTPPTTLPTRAPPGPGSARRWTGSDCSARPGSGTGTIHSACGSGWPSRSALLQPRDLLMLDEPTNGLDPQGTREVRSLIQQIAADGTTVFLSSHLLAEVEQVCSHVGVMRTGRLVFQGPLAELRRTGMARIRVQTADPEAAAAVLKRLGLPAPQVTGAEVTAQLAGHEPEQICAELVAAGVGVRGFGVATPALEDLFVALTGEGFDIHD